MTGASRPDPPDVVRVCFVCLGNICRSPTAEGVMRRLAEEAGWDHQLEIDSAGTAAFHVGDPPDRRSIAEAGRRGVDLRPLRARQFHRGDFEWFDLVVAMDERNHGDLVHLAPDHAAAAKVVMLRAFDPAVDPAARPADLDVPDPYSGGPDGFAHVFDLIDAACRGLLDHLVDQRTATQE